MADRAAFEILYKEYYPRVFALCRRLLLHLEWAQDAMQETFTHAFKTFKNINLTNHFGIGSPPSLTITVLTNCDCAVDCRRRI